MLPEVVRSLTIVVAILVCWAVVGLGALFCPVYVQHLVCDMLNSWATNLMARAVPLVRTSANPLAMTVLP